MTKACTLHRRGGILSDDGYRESLVAVAAEARHSRLLQGLEEQAAFFEAQAGFFADESRDDRMDTRSAVYSPAKLD